MLIVRIDLQKISTFNVIYDYFVCIVRHMTRWPIANVNHCKSIKIYQLLLFKHHLE